jgi:hypothetical protein
MAPEVLMLAAKHAPTDPGSPIAPSTPGATPSPPRAAALKGRLGPEVDIWSLGVCLFELVAGYKPFQGSSYQAVASAILTGAREPLPREVSRDFEDFVARCLSHDPATRPTARELLAHPWIAAAVASAGGGSTGGAPRSDSAGSIEELQRQSGGARARGLKGPGSAAAPAVLCGGGSKAPAAPCLLLQAHGGGDCRSGGEAAVAHLAAGVGPAPLGGVQACAAAAAARCDRSSLGTMADDTTTLTDECGSFGGALVGTPPAFSCLTGPSSPSAAGGFAFGVKSGRSATALHARGPSSSSAAAGSLVTQQPCAVDEPSTPAPAASTTPLQPQPSSPALRAPGRGAASALWSGGSRRSPFERPDIQLLVHTLLLAPQAPVSPSVSPAPPPSQAVAQEAPPKAPVGGGVSGHSLRAHAASCPPATHVLANDAVPHGGVVAAAEWWPTQPDEQQQPDQQQQEQQQKSRLRRPLLSKASVPRAAQQHHQQQQQQQHLPQGHGPITARPPFLRRLFACVAPAAAL